MISTSVRQTSSLKSDVTTVGGRKYSWSTAAVPRDARTPFICSPSKSRLHLRQMQRDIATVGVSLDDRPSSLSDKSRENDQFNWYKQWYAVDYLYNLDKDEKNRYQLMDDFYIVQYNDNGELVAMKEEESRDADGQITRSPGKAFPCKSRAGAIWIFPDESESALLDSKSVRVPIFDDHVDALERVEDRTTIHCTLPYSLSFSCENIIDPAHLPFTHHKSLPRMHRDIGQSTKMEAEKPMDPKSIAAASLKFFSDDRDVWCEVLSPTSVMVLGGKLEPGRDWSSTWFLFSPLTSTSSRLIMLQTNSHAVYNQRGRKKRPLILELFSKFPFLFHSIRLNVIDGDSPLLHMTQRILREGGEETWSQDSYFTPICDDDLVTQFRKWLNEKASGGPPLKETEFRYLKREEILDRYTRHTAGCKICSNALRNFKRLASISLFVSKCLCLFAVGVVYKSIDSALPYSKLCGLLGLAGIFYLLNKAIREKIIPNFYFVDYVHQYKD